MRKGNPNPRRQPKGIDQAILPAEPPTPRRAKPSDEALAATFNLSDEELKKILRQRCKERLLKNIESGEDGGTRSVEVLAKFKENDFLVHPAQQQTMIGFGFPPPFDAWGTPEDMKIMAEIEAETKTFSSAREGEKTKSLSPVEAKKEAL